MGEYMGNNKNNIFIKNESIPTFVASMRHNYHVYH